MALNLRLQTSFDNTQDEGNGGESREVKRKKFYLKNAVTFR
jgi:hypothetical protein